MHEATNKLKFYPEWSKNDSYLTEFLCSKNGNPELVDTRLDPDDIKCSYPDFGYDQILSFSGDENDEDAYKGSGWRRFMDCVSVNPKFERVRNYVNFVNQKKIQKLSEVQGNSIGRTKTQQE